MFTSKSVVHLSLCLAVASPLAVFAQPNYTVKLLPSLGHAIAIDNSGRIAGAYVARPFTYHAAIWHRGRLLDIGTGFAGDSEALGMSANGAVTGYANPSSTGSQYAFLHWNGTTTLLGSPGKPLVRGNAVNNRRQVVGEVAVGITSHAFLYQDGKVWDLGTLGGAWSAARAINNHGVVVGDSTVTEEPQYVSHGFIYRDGKMHDIGTLPGGTYSSARVINDEGMVAGVADVPGPGNTHAFIYVGGVMRNIGSFGGTTYVTGINNRGQVVGIGEAPDRSQRGFLYSDGRLQDLNNLIVSSCGWWIQQAYAINDSGQIVALARKGDSSSIARLDPSARDKHNGQDPGSSGEQEAESCS